MDNHRRPVWAEHCVMENLVRKVKSNITSNYPLPFTPSVILPSTNSMGVLGDVLYILVSSHRLFSYSVCVFCMICVERERETGREGGRESKQERGGGGGGGGGGRLSMLLCVCVCNEKKPTMVGAGAPPTLLTLLRLDL